MYGCVRSKEADPGVATNDYEQWQYNKPLIIEGWWDCSSGY